MAKDTPQHHSVSTLEKFLGTVVIVTTLAPCLFMAAPEKVKEHARDILGIQPPAPR